MEYVAFGAAVCEVEFDVLTGEKVVLQADILFDCGRSINPAADVGQVAFLPPAEDTGRTSPCKYAFL